MNRIILTLLFVVVSLTTFAQDLSKDSHALATSSSEDFLYADWLPATITLNTGEEVKAQARYNVAKQEMEVKQGDNAFVVNPKIAQKVVISNILFETKGTGDFFYQVVNKTPIFTLYKQFVLLPNKKIKGKLFKENTKTGKITPFKKDGITNNPFVLEDKNIKTKDIITTKPKELNSVDVNNYFLRNNSSSLNKGISTTSFDNRKKKITGSAYLNKAYNTGTVYLKNENNKIVAPIRFNVEKNEFELLFNTKKIVLDPTTIKKVVFDSKVFVPYTDSRFNAKFYQYLGEIDTKKILLFYKIQVVDKPYVHGISTGDPEQKQSMISTYFVSNDVTGSIRPIKKNKKSLLALFGKKKKEMEKYIKQNNINIKKSENLVKLIKYYNNL